MTQEERWNIRYQEVKNFILENKRNPSKYNKLVNLRIQELINEDEETMDIEEARTMVHETIRKEYMHSIAF